MNRTKNKDRMRSKWHSVTSKNLPDDSPVHRYYRLQILVPFNAQLPRN